MRKYSIAILLSFVASVFQAEAAIATDSKRPDVDVENATQPGAKSTGSTIELNCGERTNVKFEIYSITGQLIKTITVAQGSVKIELPKGFYIVKCENWTRRMMLK